MNNTNNNSNNNTIIPLLIKKYENGKLTNNFLTS